MPKPKKGTLDFSSVESSSDDSSSDGGFLQGLMDIPESLYKQVSKTGKSASDKLKQGDYAGAFHDVIAPVADPFTGITSAAINAMQGKKPMDVGSPDDVAKQVVGATGLPADETVKAYKKGNYSRLAGQGLAGLTMLGLSHKFGGEKTGDVETIRPDVIAPKGDINLPVEAPAPKPRLALPPAPPSVERPPTFIAGERGVVPNKPQPLDVGPINPRMGAKDQGTVLPPELGQVNQVPPEIAAQYSGQGQPLKPSPVTKPVDVDSFLKPITPSDAAQHLVESEGIDPLTQKSYKPFGIRSRQDSYDWNMSEQRDLQDSLSEAMQDKVPNLNEVKGLKADLKDQMSRPLTDPPALYLDSNVDFPKEYRTGNLDTPGGYDMHEDSPVANPLTIKDPKLAEYNKRLQDVDSPYLGTGHARPGEPQLPSAPVRTKNQVFDKPPIDEAPKIDLPSKDVEPPVKVENKEVLPPGVSPTQEVPNPGNAKVSKDVNAFRAEYGSADKTLASRPESAPIAEGIITANDKKMEWVATTQRELASLTKGLSREDRTTVGQLLDNFENPTESQVSPQLGQVALKIRQKLNEIHALVPGGIKGGNDMGFIENYLTHIESQAPSDLVDGMKQVWEYHLGKPFKDLFASEDLGPTKTIKKGKRGGDILDVGDMYETGKGDPNSQFSEKRTGKLKNLEYDINKVLPAYTESIAKLIFDKPAVDSAKRVLSTIPDSKLKELAGWYIKNYSRYDAQPGLSEGWNDWTQKLARTASRSMLGFSTGLQTLHLARIPANLWPELPTKYLLKGMYEMGKNPYQAYGEATRLGMLSNELRPWAFKTLGQKTDSVIHLFSTADFLDRSIGYHGFKQMFLDQGLKPELASAKAIAASKRASLMIDPARSTMGFSPDAKFAGGALGKLTTQFKQVPTKIIEQYIQIGSKALQDPKAAARMAMGVGTALALYEAGFHTFHVSPSQFALQTGGATLGELAKIGSPTAKSLYKSALQLKDGDVEGALQTTSDFLQSDKFYDSALEAGAFMVPAGLSLKRQLKNGPSMFEKE